MCTAVGVELKLDVEDAAALPGVAFGVEGAKLIRNRKKMRLKHRNEIQRQRSRVVWGVKTPSSSRHRSAVRIPVCPTEF